MNIGRPALRSSASAQESYASDLLYANFNQDYGCFAIGTQTGFRIFNTDPYKEKMRRDFKDGGIGMVSMLFRSNYLALVGGGRNPRFPPNKVMLWDDASSKIIAELEFRSDVLNVQLQRDRIVVILRNKCIICSLEAKPRHLHAFETCDNDRGAVAMSGNSDSGILAFPGRQKGHIQIVDLHSCINLPSTRGVAGNKAFNAIRRSGSMPGNYTKSDGSGASTSDAKYTPPASYAGSSVHPTNINIITAHTTAISALAVSADGSMVASASEKGTLIRVFDTVSGRLLHELRRGVDRADIYSIAFSPDGSRLCVSSDKGTVHIFNLELTQDIANVPVSESTNRQSNLKFMKDLLPKYFSSEWSFAHFRVPNEVRCICGFGSERNSVVVLCADGTAQKYSFDSYREVLPNLAVVDIYVSSTRERDIFDVALADKNCVQISKSKLVPLPVPVSLSRATTTKTQNKSMFLVRIRAPVEASHKRELLERSTRLITDIDPPITALSLLGLRGIACRNCNTTLTETSLIDKTNPESVRAHDLPSTYWSELVDCWICHPEEDKLSLNTDLLHIFEPESHRNSQKQRSVQGSSDCGVYKSLLFDIWVGHTHLFLPDGLLRLLPTTCIALESKSRFYNEYTALICDSCNSIVGEVGYMGQKKLFKLYLHRINIQTKDKEQSISISLSQVISSELIDHAAAHAIYKFIIEERDSCKPAILIHLQGWNSHILSGNVEPDDNDNTILSNGGSLKVAYLYRGMDGFDKAISECDSNGSAERVSLFSNDCDRLSKALLESTSLIPYPIQKLANMNRGFFNL